MEPRASFIRWSPRLLAMIFTVFISVFAMDAFEGLTGWWDKAFSLFMHLIPTWLCLILLVLAWRREWIGALAFTMLAIIHFFWGVGRLHWSACLAIEGPLLLLGVLYGIAWFRRTPARA